MYMVNKYNKKRLNRKSSKLRQKYNNSECNDKMTFQECELAILRQSVDENEENQGRRVANNEDVKKMLNIVEEFLLKKKLICYGGTAINNILPKSVQFYNKETEIPDYDFFSPNAAEDSKELADIYFRNGYSDVEAKSGMHVGTYKVFVNFIPIADITYLVPEIYNAIHPETIIIAGIHYAPPNYLRMAMYLELSRPAGDVSRWEKVMTRLNLLNTYYPMAKDECSHIDFQRGLDDKMGNAEQLYIIVRDTLINQGVVFFGGYAFGLYSRYSDDKRYRMKEVPDFDVLSDDPERTAVIVKEQLLQAKFKNITNVIHKPIGELIPERLEILVGKETVVNIYRPIACHSYNTITMNNKDVNVATIDTILSFYLVMIYLDIDLNYNRMICMANFLFEIQMQNRLNQRGLLKRFTMKCYGKQLTIEDVRAEKAHKYREFKEKGMTAKNNGYEKWFLKYTPGEKLLNKQRKTQKVKRDVVKTKLPAEPKKKNIFDLIRDAARTH
jgi:hypothetical protein